MAGCRFRRHEGFETSMSAQTIHIHMRAAARALLQTVQGLPAVAWEGKRYTAKVGVPFIRESMRPSLSIPRALGRGGTISHTMTLYLVLFYPIGEGTLAAEDMAGKIVAKFPPGLSLVYSGSSGVITQSQRRAIITEPDWLSLPVEISITAYTVN
jgi:hypothetical protein